MTRSLLIAAVLATALPAVAAAPAADSPGATDTARTVIRPKRLVHFFDFDERKLGNFEELPMHWYVMGRPAQTSDPNFQRQPLHQALIQRPGFPAYTTIRFDDRRALSGNHSFYLGLNGGNAGAFLEVGTLPAVPTSDYLITASVQTRGLHRAAARIVGYFVDAAGLPIPASRTASAPIRDVEDWTTISIRLPGDFPDAAWIGIELELLQPAADPDHPLGGQQIVLQDVSGGAWFDDISVWQLPHLDLGSQSPVNIIRAPRLPRITVDVRDLSGQPMRAELTVYDHRHQAVDSTVRPVGAGEPMSWRWTPNLPRFGWYLVDLQIHEDANPRGAVGPVARTVSALLWMPPDAPLSFGDRHRFAIAAEGLPTAQLKRLPDLLDATRLDAVIVSAWSPDTTLQTLEREQDRLDDILREILSVGRSVTMSLHPVPAELADLKGVETASPLGVLRADDDLWLPYLAPVLMRQGQRIRRWQLGESQDAQAFYHGDLSGVLSQVERRFSALAPQPRLILPWRLDQSRRPELTGQVTVALDVPTAVAPDQLPANLAQWQDPPASYWLYLHEPPADQVAHQRRAADLALRMVRGWQGHAGGLVLPRPWTPAVDKPNVLWPGPLLGVFANTAQRLAGRQVVGELPLGPGLEALILDGEAGGMIVAWNRSADPDDAVIHMLLGDSPVAIDLWGNAAPVPISQGRHRLALTQAPTFITGIDVELALLRASFRLTPSFVEALQRPHAHQIELRNPWQRTISGTLLFTGPESWSIQPVRHQFSLSPGQTMRLPVDLSFPFAELAGPKRLTARVEFVAERGYQIELSTAMELGLPDVQFHPTVALEPGSRPGLMDAELVCVVTNIGDRPRSLSAFANLRGQPRQERAIANLKPGDSIVRRFTFTDLDADARTAPLRTGIRELNGPAVLNKVLPLAGPISPD